MHRRILAVIGAALLLSGCGSATDAEGRPIAEWVLGLGGTVRINSIDRELKSAASLPESDFALVEIKLNEKPVGNADLEKLSELKHLRVLSLQRTQVTDAGLDAILPITTLEELELSYNLISDDGLAKLAQLPRLRKLYLYGTTITDAGVSDFRSSHPGLTIYR